MDCLSGQRYVSAAGDRRILEGYLDQANSEITSQISETAQSPCISTMMPIRTRGPMGYSVINLPSTVRTVELTEDEWYLSVPRHWHQARGIQVPNHDKILLKRGNWCRETILHEALHRFSIFSSDPSIRLRFAVFEDGITEFLVGFVLWKIYPVCYESWRAKTFHECSMTYPRSVLRFYAFCNFVSMKNLVNLYFWQPSVSWVAAWTQFLTSLRTAGYSDFEDVTEKYPWADPSLEPFFDQCEEQFGRKFKQLYSSKIDYNRIIC